jgi:digeranylgeranylglycerophospholipid reductase
MSLKCDVLVVGAGPGGGAAARFAAKQGADVLLVDRKKEIGVPVRCAEATLANCVEDVGLKVSSISDQMYNRLELNFPRGKSICANTSLAAVGLNRPLFEKKLSDLAADKGARIMLGTRVKGLTKHGVLTSAGEIKAKAIIAADGVESHIGRWSGLHKSLPVKDIGSCVQFNVKNMEAMDNTIQAFFSERYTPNGYAWIFAKGDDTANVGVMVAGNKGHALKLARRFLNKKAPKGKPLHMTAGCVPLAPPLRSYVNGNIMLVGDAARFANAAAGGGLHSSLMSGKLAGIVAGNAIVKERGVSSLMRYQNIWNNGHVKQLERAYRIKEKYVSMGDAGTMKLYRLLKPLKIPFKLAPGLILKAMWGRYGSWEKMID